jgi:thioester reductase-like protein
MPCDARRENGTSPTPGVDLENASQSSPPTFGAAIAGRLPKPEQQLLGAPAPTEVFRDAVRAAKIGADEDISHLSASLIDKYVADLKHLGLLANHEGKSA